MLSFGRERIHALFLAETKLKFMLEISDTSEWELIEGLVNICKRVHCGGILNNIGMMYFTLYSPVNTQLPCLLHVQ